MSIVVPAFNVESYVRRCLESIVAQNTAGVEIIVVDDGSTDASAEAVHSVKPGPNITIRYVYQRNRGLGSARNKGVRLARGRYLMFVDSDDALQPGALPALLNQITKSGADFVSGDIARGRDGKITRYSGVTPMHRNPASSVTIWQRPDMLADLMACGKLFNTAFFKRQVGRFPTRTYYEDQVPLVRAYLASTSFDIMRKSVYIYHVRSDGSSISQRGAEESNLRDRMSVTKQVRELLERQGDPRLVRTWLDRRVLMSDARMAMRHVDDMSQELYSDMVSWLRRLFDGFDWESPATALPMRRLMVWLALNRDRHTVVRAADLGHRLDDQLPIMPYQGGAVARPDLVGFAVDGVPKQVLQLSPDSLVLDAEIREAQWVSDGLELSGWAFIRHLSLESSGTDIALELVASDGRCHASLTCKPTGRRYAGPPVRDPWCSYDRASVSCVIPAELMPSTPGAELVVRFRVNTSGVERSGAARRPGMSAQARAIVPGPRHNGGRVIPRWTSKGLVLSWRNESDSARADGAMTASQPTDPGPIAVAINPVVGSRKERIETAARQYQSELHDHAAKKGTLHASSRKRDSSV